MIQLSESHFYQVNPEKKTSLLGDLSDPFHNFPRVVPHACVNMSQTFLKDLWTIVCVNDPQVMS